MDETYNTTVYLILDEMNQFLISIEKVLKSIEKVGFKSSSSPRKRKFNIWFIIKLSFLEHVF